MHPFFFFSNKQDPNPQVKFFELFLPLTTIETILKRKLILKPLLCLNLIYSVVPPIRFLYLSPLFVNSNYLHLQNVHFLFYFLSKLAASLAASTHELTLSLLLFYCECLWWMSVGVVAMLRHVWFLWFLPRCLFVLFLIFFSLIWLFDLSRIKVYACMHVLIY